MDWVDQGAALAVDPDDLVSKQPPPEVDVVVHGVQDETAADLEIGKGDRRRVHVAADRTIEDGFADPSLIDDALGFDISRIKSTGVTEHELDTRGPGRHRRAVTPLETQTERLFAQDVQPGGGAVFDIGHVGRGAARDHDRVEALGLEQRIEIVVDGHGAAAPADLGGPLGTGRRHGDEVRTPDA